MKSSTLRTTAIATGLAATATGAFVTADTASAAPRTATVMAASTQGQTGPSLNFARNRSFSKGKVLTLACYDRGQAVRGYYSSSVTGGTSDIWYQTSGDGGVWVPDIDISTGSNAPVVGRCAPNLPWTEGRGYVVTQTPGGSYSHANVYNQHSMDIGLPSGTPLRAPETGIVAFSGWNPGGGGNVVMVKRPGTNNCIQVAHLSTLSVGVGARVIRGQVIGYSGATGGVTGAHLHLGVVNCTSWYSQYVLPTQERGTSYPQGALLTSWNAR